MYNISAFSKLSNTPIQTLRYYDRLELLKPGHIGKVNNYRYYTNDQLVKIKMIKKLKKMGFSLKEISILFNKCDKKDLLKQKERLQHNVNNDLKSIKEIDEIIQKMKNKTNLEKELINLMNKEERRNIKMREKYNDAKEKLLACYKEYHEGSFDQCLVLLEELKNQIFISGHEEGDPFWPNSAGDLFTGITLEVIKNNKIEDVTFLNIFYFRINDQEWIKDFENYTNSLDKDSYSYLSLSAISNAPLETKGSIISVYQQKMKLYAMFDTKK